MRDLLRRHAHRKPRDPETVDEKVLVLLADDLTAYDYFQLGKESKATVSNIDRGIEYLTKAIALDPTLARAYSIRAWLYNFSIMFGGDAATGLKRMVDDAEKAVEIDPQDCESLGTLAFARMYQSRWN